MTTAPAALVATPPIPETARSTCRCGHDLVRVARGGEWAWVSVLTGCSSESADHPALVDGWAALAERDPALYSTLRARDLLGHLRSHHWHSPVEEPVYEQVPECCGWPMRSTPDGWACRQHRAAA